MLTKQRQDLLLELLEERGSITVSEVKDMLDASESTIRRDITALDEEGKLVKVFGGAVAARQMMITEASTAWMLLHLSIIKCQKSDLYFTKVHKNAERKN